MKVLEVLGFKDAETEMPTYDNMLANPEYFANDKNRKGSVVMMSPDEYIAKSLKGFQRNRPTVTKELLRKGRDSKIIDTYAADMKAGAEFPTLMLDYSMGFSQEGLHRAYAAKQLGLEEIPVMVVSMTRKKDRGSDKANY